MYLCTGVGPKSLLQTKQHLHILRMTRCISLTFPIIFTLFTSSFVPADNDTKTNNSSSGEIFIPIVTYSPGDVNGDKIINETDFTAIVNRILNRNVKQPFKEEAADVNLDGKISVSDLAQLIEYKLNGIPVEAKPRKQEATDEKQ